LLFLKIIFNILIPLGPKLPGSSSIDTLRPSTTSPATTEAAATAGEETIPASASKSVYSLTAPTLAATSPSADTAASNNQWTHQNTAEAHNQQSPSSKSPAGPKINYTKDELGKYGDLAMMSQAYAKINQVSVVNFGSNGSTEINMVELDNGMSASLPVQQHQQQVAASHEQQQLQLINQQQLLQFQHEQQQQQQNQVLKYHLQQQQQQRNIQLQLQNLQQLRASQQIQQLGGLHNLHLLQAQQALHAQQQHKQQIIAMQLEQLNLLKQQHQMSIRNAQQQQQQHQQYQVIHQLEAPPLELEISELSNLIAPQNVTISSSEPVEKNDSLQPLSEVVQKDQELSEATTIIESIQPETNTTITNTTTDESALTTSPTSVVTIETTRDIPIENKEVTPEAVTEIVQAQHPQQQNQDSSETMAPPVLDSMPPVASQSPRVNPSQQLQQPEYLVACSPDRALLHQSNHSINSNSPHSSHSPLLVSHSPNFVHLQQQQQQQQQQQRIQYQPIQFASLQNSHSGLIQLAGNSGHALINYQQQQHLPNPQLALGQQLYEQPQHLTVLNAQQIAAIQQSQLHHQLQVQAQQQHLQQQQQQAAVVAALQQQQLQFQHLQHPGLSGLTLQHGGFMQPQIIQLRPSLVAQPQFIVNSSQVPLYRILPQ